MSPGRPPCGNVAGVSIFDRQFKAGKCPVGLWLKAASEPKMAGTVGSLAPKALSCSRPAAIALMAAIFPVNQFFRQYQCRRTIAVGKDETAPHLLRRGFFSAG